VSKHPRAKISTMDSKGESNYFGGNVDMDILYPSLKDKQDLSTREGDLKGLISWTNGGEFGKLSPSL
jgi:hypothetical protein